MKSNKYIIVVLIFAFLPIGRTCLAQTDLAKKLSGRILLRVAASGQAWYVNPLDLKRYYLGRPADAFDLMRRLALGINETDINKIPIGYVSLQTAPVVPPDTNPAPVSVDPAKQAIESAASAIRSGNTSTAITYFTPNIKKLVEYTMSVLGGDGRLALGNMMSAAKLKITADNEKTYATEIYVGIVGRKVEVKFRVKKQPDGAWLIANL